VSAAGPGSLSSALSHVGELTTAEAEALAESFCLSTQRTRFCRCNGFSSAIVIETHAARAESHGLSIALSAFMRTHTTLVLLTLSLSACAGTVNDVARQASKAAVDEGAEELTKQDTQQSLQNAAEDPQIQAATAAMTEQVAQGVLNSLDSDQAKEQIAGLTRTAVQQLVASLGSQQTRAQLAALTGSVADAALAQVATSLKEDFRPAIRSMIQEDLAQGMAAALQSQQLQPALGQAAQTVAYHAVMGANDGLGAAWLGSDGMMGEARSMSGSVAGFGMGWVWVALAALGMFTLMMVSGATMMIARSRRTHHEVERLESATLLLATAMREKQQTEQTDEILAVVQQALEGRAEKSGKHRILDALRMRKAG